MAVTLEIAAAPVPAAHAAPASGGTVVGTVVRAYVEHRGEQDAGAQSDFGAPVTFVHSPTGAAVRVPTQALSDVPVGATVAVTVGAAVSDSATTTDHLDPAQQVLASTVLAAGPGSPPSPTTASSTPAATDTVSIAMVVPAGASQDSTPLAAVVDQVSGPVSQFWAGQSNGAIHLAVADTHDWGTTSVGEDCSDPEALWADVAGQIGFTPGPGKHLLLYVPSTDTDCSYGLAEVGSGLHAGGYLYVRDTPTSLIAHELGHNFGLLHSGRQECQGALETGSCSTQEYGDLYDVMGASWDQVGSLNAAQSARLGFLPATQVRSIAASDDNVPVVLSPLSGGTGTRAVRLTSSAGATYYLEYRTASGQDAFLGSGSTVDWTALRPGVLLHRVVTTSAADSSMLVDGTPTATADYPDDDDDVLPPGVTAVAAGGEFRITVSGESATAATISVDTQTPIATAYARSGGPAGPLGAPAGAERCGLAGGGCRQTFAHGEIAWSPGTGARLVSGALWARWAQLGWEVGALGYPTGDVVCGLRAGGCYQLFERGALYWSPGTGARLVSGALWARWAQLGWEVGALGYPTGDVVCGLRAGGCYQLFERGALYWSPGTGARLVSGALWARWAQLGWEVGALGYPTGDVVCGLRAGGCYQLFERGALYWSPGTGARLVSGALWARWAQLGWEVGALGYPTGDVVCGLRAGGCYQLFERGALYWSPGTGARLVSGALWARWAQLGWEVGALGYPTGDVVCGLRAGGCYQLFERGALYWSPGTGARLVSGYLWARWAQLGWEGGALGYPVSDPSFIAGRWTQYFEHGVL